MLPLAWMPSCYKIKKNNSLIKLNHCFLEKVEGSSKLPSTFLSYNFKNSKNVKKVSPPHLSHFIY